MKKFFFKLSKYSHYHLVDPIAPGDTREDILADFLNEVVDEIIPHFKKKEWGGLSITNVSYEDDLVFIYSDLDSDDTSDPFVLTHDNLITLMQQWYRLRVKGVMYITIVENNGYYCLKDSHTPPVEVIEHRRNNL